MVAPWPPYPGRRHGFLLSQICQAEGGELVKASRVILGQPSPGQLPPEVAYAFPLAACVKQLHPEKGCLREWESEYLGAPAWTIFQSSHMQ